MIACSSLSGCALFERKDVKNQETIYVDRVVTAQPRKPKIPPRPRLPIEDLTEAQMKDIGELSKAFKGTVKTVEGYVSELETVMDGVGTAENPTPTTK